MQHGDPAWFPSPSARGDHRFNLFRRRQPDVAGIHVPHAVAKQPRPPQVKPPKARTVIHGRVQKKVRTSTWHAHVAKYHLILVDPPWQYARTRGKGTTREHYATMSAGELRALPVADLAAPDCALLLWTTGPMYPEALRLIDAWGFQYKNPMFVWVKTTKADRPMFGLGSYTRSCVEFVLLATRGKILPYKASSSVSQLLWAQRREHSRKPEELYDRLAEFFGDNYRQPERMRKIELFARERRVGWYCWGNETSKFNHSVVS